MLNVLLQYRPLFSESVEFSNPFPLSISFSFPFFLAFDFRRSPFPPSILEAFWAPGKTHLEASLEAREAKLCMNLFEKYDVFSDDCYFI